GSANTDTMMVMHIPANGSKATVLSFPRDSYVEIPGYGMDKLNAAYPDGYNAALSKGASELDAESAGITLLDATLSQLSGLHIDHYVQINLLGFYRISEAIGGVPVLLCQAQKEANSGINLPAGWSTIEGTQALAFVRQRDGLPGGDLDRIRRQQYFLTTVFHLMTNSGTLLNPFKIKSLLNAVGASLLTDPSLNILTLAEDFQQMSSGNLVFHTIPTDGFNNNTPSGDVVVVTPTEVQAYVDQQFDIVADPTLAAATAAAPGGVSVTVDNDSGTNGAATSNSATLATLGFQASVGNGTQTQSITEIQYPDGMQSQAKAVLAHIPGATPIKTSSVSGVTLVLGTDGLKVTAPAPPTSGSSTATATHAATPAPSPSPTGPTAGVPANTPNQPGCIN
ncbi:MAG TPA: LCP family protein, partial [Jatrophihabitantaceae bacterium]|nr:LCP family protein [Jatrophihabitantaceae bacterium]